MSIRQKATFAKHGIHFDEAKTVFRDPALLTYPDDFHSDTEDRMIGIGYSSRQRLLLVVYTEYELEHEFLLRIISCRRATAAERKNL